MSSPEQNNNTPEVTVNPEEIANITENRKEDLKKGNTDSALNMLEKWSSKRLAYQEWERMQQLQEQRDYSRIWETVAQYDESNTQWMDALLSSFLWNNPQYQAV